MDATPTKQMGKLLKYLMLILVSTISITFSSCGGDDKDEPEATPYFAGQTTANQFSELGGTIDCSIINCNPQTTQVHSTVSWMTAEIRNGLCSIKIEKNNTSTVREGVIELLMYGYLLVDRFYVTQKAGNNISGGGGSESGEQGEFGAPSGLTLSKNGYAVTLSWNKVPKADKYWIYYSNPVAYNSGYFVTMYNTTSTTYTMDCKMAGNWAFKVQAQEGSNYSDYSNTVTTNITENDINGGGGSTSQKPSKPTGLKATVNGNQVQVSWNASTNASYYRLYYIKPAPYNVESFDNVYSTSITMNCTITGTWTIWVVAAGANGESSEASSKVTFNITSSSGGGSSTTTTKLDTPTGLKVNSTASDSYVQLQCNAVSLGYDYQLYRSTSPNSGYTKITASVGSNTSGSIIYFTDQSPKKGTTYYKVKVAALPSLGIKDSDFSDYVKVDR